MSIGLNVDIPDTVAPIRADVYYNLDEGGLSVKDRRTGYTTYGRVIEHTEWAFIRDPEVITYESKRKQACDGPKNVHAMFRGQVTTSMGSDEFHPMKSPVELEYDVDHECCFVHGGRGVVGAEAIEITVTDDGPRIAAVGVDYSE